MQYTNFVRTNKLIRLQPFAGFDVAEPRKAQSQLLELTFNPRSHLAAEGDLERRKYNEQEVDDFIASFMDLDH
jgi:hypothetical protein